MSILSFVSKRNKVSRILIFFIALSIIQNSTSAIEIVSLGGACLIARAARHNNVRDTAYPFDWMITSMQSIKKSFQDDCAQVLIPEQTNECQENKAVIDGYGFIFIHDFPTIRNTQAPIDGEIMPVHPLVPHWRDSIEIVKAKFNRRLQRLLKLLHDGKPVALVRYNEIDRDEAEQFITFLMTKFPQAKVVLVAVGSTPEFQQPWNLSHVENMFIAEKDFQAWDGKAWADVMQKIASLNPEGWTKTTCNSYVLTAPLYNPGLFNVFNSVLGALDLYDKKQIDGLCVNFQDKGRYYDPAKGANWWDYYFEPIEIGNHNNTHKLFPTYQKIKFAYETQFEMPLERANELIKKYIHVKPFIVKKVDDFYSDNLTNFFVIGVHYRGTDKLSDASSISYDEVSRKIQQILQEKNDLPIKIFVATDDSYFALYIKEKFPDLVIMRDAIRSDSNEGIHIRKDLDSYKKGEEAIIDCLLLSRCSLLIKTASNLSDCSRQFNPKMPAIQLNKSFTE